VAPVEPLLIPAAVWWRLIGALRRRGRGDRESGAFLLGRRHASGAKVHTFLCYDEADPHALDSGIVIITSAGFQRLWDTCRALGCDVVGDAHTHGDRSPRQSETDRVNPVMPIAGHMALIVPSFGMTPRWHLGESAAYEYLGNYRWRYWAGRERATRVRLTMW
jgi:proteasome lid subunit RPN8/RPN11